MLQIENIRKLESCAMAKPKYLRRYQCQNVLEIWRKFDSKMLRKVKVEKAFNWA
jgi:hypothetical protein